MIFPERRNSNAEKFILSGNGAIPATVVEGAALVELKALVPGKARPLLYDLEFILESSLRKHCLTICLL